jgi:hypothetical protein
VHTQKKNGFRHARITNTWNRTGPKTVNDFSSAIDSFREQVVAGAMEIFYLDVPQLKRACTTALTSRVISKQARDHSRVINEEAR